MCVQIVSVSVLALRQTIDMYRVYLSPRHLESDRWMDCFFTFRYKLIVVSLQLI